MSETENRRIIEIRSLLVLVILMFMLGFFCLLFYFLGSRNEFIKYHEKSDIDYKVLLNENEFFKDQYIEKDKGYIASLINKISANFSYQVNFDEELNYKYSYRIVAEIDVLDTESGNNIYHYSEDLIKKDLAAGQKSLKIDENVDIRYADYNNVISKFKDVYDLRNEKATLNVYLYVNIDDMERVNVSNFQNKKVSSLAIPLTENTVSVDIGNDIINNNSSLKVTNNVGNSWLVVGGLFFIVVAIVYLIYLIVYIRKSRTAQMIYDKEIKSIMNNYDSFIQKISGSYDIGTSQVLKVESFNDMLEIRDTLKQPILMLENDKHTGSFFIIPATNSIIYTYALRVVDIKAKMNGKEVPMYDITKVLTEDFTKKKKYTDKYIKDQITMTQAMPKVDEKNVIKGSKSKDKDLYSQLEMTRSYNTKEIRKAARKYNRKSKNKKK